MDERNRIAMERRLRELGSRVRFEFPAQVVPAAFRRAAVLVAFWRDGEELNVVLTERAHKLRSHGGMVSFPGGVLEEGEDWIAAALRESHEEVGLEPESVEVLGMMDDAWSGAKHHLVPVVGWLDKAPSFTANEDEVAKIIVANVSELLQPEARSEETIYLGTLPCVNTTIEVTSGKIFGLTADLLLEVLEWAAGAQPQRGRVRLAELEAWKIHRG